MLAHFLLNIMRMCVAKWVIIIISELIPFMCRSRKGHPCCHLLQT